MPKVAGSTPTGIDRFSGCEEIIGTYVIDYDKSSRTNSVHYRSCSDDSGTPSLKSLQCSSPLVLEVRLPPQTLSSVLEGKKTEEEARDVLRHRPPGPGPRSQLGPRFVLDSVLRLRSG
ncbi:hypothetical protein TNCV_620371 [Trichonephila clavipes]|nr:hypothetical protein TNCV_620371 [Trichonephila clavipes]